MTNEEMNMLKELLKQEIDPLKKTVDRLVSDVDSLKQDMAVVKETTAETAEGVKVLNSWTETLDVEVRKLKQDAI